MKRVLVTGGAGFIGAHIVEELVRRGERVRVLDDLSTGKRENLLGFIGTIEFVRGDVGSARETLEAVTGCELVIHLAARPSVQRSIDDPVATNEVNVDGTLNVLMAAKETGVRRVVMASSSSVYGDSPTLPKHEQMIPNPKSPYAVSKLAAEHYLRVFHQLYGLETVALRYFNVFGPRQDPGSHYAAVIPRFVTASVEGGSPVVFGDGGQTRDFTYVANVVDATLRACVAPVVAGRVVNVAGGRRLSLLDVIATLSKLLGRDIKPTFSEARAGDVRHSLADISLARELLGYEPLVDVSEGLAKVVEWRAEEAEKALAPVEPGRVGELERMLGLQEEAGLEKAV